jgi:hypothetical protein
VDEFVFGGSNSPYYVENLNDELNLTEILSEIGTFRSKMVRLAPGLAGSITQNNHRLIVL